MRQHSYLARLMPSCGVADGAMCRSMTTTAHVVSGVT